MLAHAILVFLANQPIWTPTALFHVLEGLFELGQVEGSDTVPVLDTIFCDRDFGVGEVEVVEVEEKEF